MKFRTSLPVASSDLQINYRSSMVLLGSCFSENIGQALTDRKFTALINPLGISYNPISILKNVTTIAENIPLVESDLQSHNNSFFHYDYHGSHNAQNGADYISNINERIKEAHSNLKNADILFISLGTANVFTHKEHGIVNNCHKMPNALFNRNLLRVEEMTDALHQIKSVVQTINKNIKVVFTVSPIRHIRDGLVIDRRSKSLLIAALAHMINDKDVFYFPSYELLVDDLRDYRFYKEDLIHPTEQAIRYIWEHFAETFLTAETKSVVLKVEKINDMLAHKIINPKSEDAKMFQEKIRKEMASISDIIPIEKWDH